MEERRLIEVRSLAGIVAANEFYQARRIIQNPPRQGEVAQQPAVDCSIAGVALELRMVHSSLLEEIDRIEFSKC